MRLALDDEVWVVGPASPTATIDGVCRRTAVRRVHLADLEQSGEAIGCSVGRPTLYTDEGEAVQEAQARLLVARAGRQAMELVVSALRSGAYSLRALTTARLHLTDAEGVTLLDGPLDLS